jgi:hypothetical protein
MMDENYNSDNESVSSSEHDHDNDFWLEEERNLQLRKNTNTLNTTSRASQLKMKALSVLHSPLPLMKFSTENVIRKPATTFLGKNIKFIDSNICNIGIDGTDNNSYKKLDCNKDNIKNSNNTNTNINQKDNVEKDKDQRDYLHNPLYSHQLKPWFQSRSREELAHRYKEGKKRGDTSKISSTIVYQSDIFSK